MNVCNKYGSKVRTILLGVTILTGLLILLLSSFSMAASMIKVNADPNGKTGSCVIGIGSPCNGPNVSCGGVHNLGPCKGNDQQQQHHQNTKPNDNDNSNTDTLARNISNMVKSMSLIDRCRFALNLTYDELQLGNTNDTGPNSLFVQKCGNFTAAQLAQPITK